MDTSDNSLAVAEFEWRCLIRQVTEINIECTIGFGLSSVRDCSGQGVRLFDTTLEFTDNGVVQRVFRGSEQQDNKCVGDHLAEYQNPTETRQRRLAN